MNPFLSLSKVRNTWSQNSLALPVGKHLEYILIATNEYYKRYRNQCLMSFYDEIDKITDTEYYPYAMKDFKLTLSFILWNTCRHERGWSEFTIRTVSHKPYNKKCKNLYILFMYRVFMKIFFSIHCNPSLAYIAVRDLRSSQHNASVQSLLLAGNFWEVANFREFLKKNTIFNEQPVCMYTFIILSLFSLSPSHTHTLFTL